MSLYEIFPKLKTREAWTNFLTGLVIGIGLTATILFSLKSFLDLKLVSNNECFTQKEVNDSYISKDVVKENYITRTELAAKYIEKDKLLNETGRSNSPDLSQYILKTDVERDYILKTDCQKKFPSQKPKPIAPIKMFLQADNPLNLSEIGFKAEFNKAADIFDTRYPYHIAITLPDGKKEEMRKPSIITFAVEGRRFTFRASSIKPDGAQVSLVEQ